MADPRRNEEPMPDDAFSRRMAALRAHAPESAPGWDTAREQALWTSLRAPRRRLGPAGVAAAAAAVLVLAASAFGLGRLSVRGEERVPGSARAAETPPLPEEVPEASRDAAPSPVVRFADGSTATRLDGASELQVLEVGADGTRLGLVRGAARFDVVPQHRPFRVEAGPVAVEVLGTAFEVRHLGDARVAVTVDHGRVRVAWTRERSPGDATAGADELGAGEQGVFPPLLPPLDENPALQQNTALQEQEQEQERAAPQAGEASGTSALSARPRARRSSDRQSPALSPAPPSPAVAPPSSARDWRQLADEGRMQAAYEALEERRFQVRDEVAELMEASDVARLSGHPREALPPLRQVLSRHARDPRAASAAFTLGRLYLETLGEPGRAALAFAQARQLRPRGPLAVDAFAREVEARGRAGDGPGARSLAARFLAAHPNHPRAGSVRRWSQASDGANGTAEAPHP
ncbi:MAG: FecR family protein [Myxococcota bacterium]